ASAPAPPAVPHWVFPPDPAFQRRPVPGIIVEDAQHASSKAFTRKAPMVRPSRNDSAGADHPDRPPILERLMADDDAEVAGFDPFEDLDLVLIRNADAPLPHVRDVAL